MIGGFSPPTGSKEERKLISLFKTLESKDQQTLLKFAQFLSSPSNSLSIGELDSDDPKPAEEVLVPVEIERPEKESVIKAIKRLNKTYPMIDKSALLDKTSSLMMDHIMKGREAVSVIDELETLFKEQYEKTKLS